MKGNREENKKIKGEWADGDLPVCEEYIYAGSDKHLKEFEEAEKLGVTYLEK